MHDAIETTDSCWRSPAQALADYQAGDFSLAPPTWRILNDLKAQNSLESLWNWSLRDNPVPRIDPVMSLDEGSVVLALPGDRMHSGSGEGLRRIVLRDRRWVWISAT